MKIALWICLIFTSFIKWDSHTSRMQPPEWCRIFKTNILHETDGLANKISNFNLTKVRIENENINTFFSMLTNPLWKRPNWIAWHPLIYFFDTKRTNFQMSLMHTGLRIVRRIQPFDPSQSSHNQINIRFIFLWTFIFKISHTGRLVTVLACLHIIDHATYIHSCRHAYQSRVSHFLGGFVILSQKRKEKKKTSAKWIKPRRTHNTQFNAICAHVAYTCTYLMCPRACERRSFSHV